MELICCIGLSVTLFIICNCINISVIHNLPDMFVVADTHLNDTKSYPKEKIINNKIIVYLNDVAYDITDFAIKHPGGRKCLTDYHGKDIKYVMKNNKHSEKSYKILEKYKVDN